MMVPFEVLLFRRSHRLTEAIYGIGVAIPLMALGLHYAVKGCGEDVMDRVVRVTKAPRQRSVDVLSDQGSSLGHEKACALRRGQGQGAIVLPESRQRVDTTMWLNQASFHRGGMRLRMTSGSSKVRRRMDAGERIFLRFYLAWHLDSCRRS
jgi:hypothetical protein